MKLYFLSSQPCLLAVNGTYFGTTDEFPRSADVHLNDRFFAEFLPEHAHPIRFFITEDLTTVPPQGCEVYLTENGIAVYARDFAPTDDILRVFWQKEEGNLRATLFRQGHLYLSLQTPETFFNAYLPPTFADCNLHFLHGNVLLTTDEELILLRADGKQLLHEKILSFSVDGQELRAQISLCDHLGRFADCAWHIDSEGCARTAFNLLERTENGASSPSNGLIAYAFLKSVFLGIHYEEFLCEALRPEAAHIRAFLGNFEGVVVTDNPLRCGLIRKQAERLFRLDYFSVTVTDGKITDLLQN